MYCKKCGKQLDFDGDICKECADNEQFFATETPVAEPAPVQPEVQSAPVATPAPQAATPVDPTNTRKYGLGKALASTIMGFVGYLISYIILSVLTALIEELGDSYGAVEIESTGLMFFVLVAYGLAIPSLIMGIKSIVTFVKRAKGGYVKPIATLILGIAGVALSAIVFLFNALSVLMLMLPSMV